MWSNEAHIIRNEMASLAETDPEAITEATPLFSLGLDSVDAIKLSARLKKRGIAIKTSELLKAQTISAIMQLLQTQAPDANTHETNAMTQTITEITSALREYLTTQGNLGENETVLPVTPLQESMVMEMVASDFQLYFNHDILELSPTIDLSKLKQAWETVINGSPILRTKFLPVETPAIKSSFCQIIGADFSSHITEVNLDGCDELSKLCDTAVVRAREGEGRSDLLQLVFATINDQNFLVLSIAHALYDGWSLDLIHRNVQDAYEGRYEPETLQLYLRQLDEVLLYDSGDASIFWSGFLQDATPTMFPQDEAKSDKTHLVHQKELTSLTSLSSITSFCKTNAVTLQTLGQACWAALLAAKTRSLDLVFGVVLSCRDTEAMQELVFPTMNTVPVRSVLHGKVLSWLHYMQENATSIVAYQQFPLRKAQQLAKTNGPLFNTLFVQQRSSLPRDENKEGWMKSVGGSSAVEYPVCVEVEVMESGLVWRMACEGGYASQDETVKMLQDLDRILQYLVRYPEADVLVFHGEKVSICGSSHVELLPSETTPNAALNEVNMGESDVWSPLEGTIRNVLAEVSGVETASILKSNNIYHLGLDSISAIKVGSLLKKRGVRVGFRNLLKAGSISEMARFAQDAHSTDDSSTLNTPSESQDGSLGLDKVGLPVLLQQAGIKEASVEQVLPASAMQVHMVSVWQNTQGEVFYPCFRYNLSGLVNANTIARAWKILVAETPILRTVFLSTNTQSVPLLQVVTHSSTLEDDEVADGLINRSAFQHVHDLVERCKSHGISLQSLFLAAYATFLSSKTAPKRQYRPKSVVFGIYLANRTETADSEPGARLYPFLRLVPLRVELREGDAVDVEVSVQDGKMTIGVFGSSEKLGDEAGARHIMDGVLEVLRGAM
ncbi:hypothetical protein N0V88_007314 [Collariella sp. IMI 366227]|nr:hypothetical protein N0V88_007314 [Collariella sp. IMI 366227]